MSTQERSREAGGSQLLYDLPAAAKALGGIGVPTLRQWISQGRIEVVRLGRRVLIRHEALEQLIQAFQVSRTCGRKEKVGLSTPARSGRSFRQRKPEGKED